MNALHPTHKSTRRSWVALAGITILICTSNVLAQTAPRKKIVAVFDFANTAIQSGADNTNTQANAPDVGKAVSQLLVAKLVQDGKATLVERAAIEKVIAEQNLSNNSGRFDPKTAAKLGKILGADSIIIGSITRYDYEEQLKGYVGHRRGARNSESPQAKYDVTAKLQVTARLVATETAEVLSVADGVGETTSKNVVMDVRDTSGHVAQAVSMNSPAVNQTLDQAVTQLAAKLELSFAPSAPAN